VETFLDILRSVKEHKPAASTALAMDPLRQRSPTWHGQRINLPLTAQRILAPYRLRIVLRMVFLSLALAIVGLAISVLQQEKQLSYESYAQSFRKTQEQLAATLRHPAGQLALLNPRSDTATGGGLHPLLLPFPALDFDDQHKVRQAVAMSGCLAQVGQHGSLCACRAG
jgi:hypothetical protein